MNDYAELHCISNFTFLRGASHPEELVATAAALGYAALAITDECSLAGIVRAHVAAKEQGLKLIVGSEFHLAEGHRLVLLAPDDMAYRQLCRLITRGRRRSEKGHYRLHLADMEEDIDHCLLILIPAGAHDALPLDWLQRHHHGRAWLAAQRLLRNDEEEMLARLAARARAHGIPLVACGDVHMHVRERRALQDILTAIRHNTPLAKLGYRLFANGERHLRPRRTLARLYRREWLAESLRIAARCHFDLDSLRYDYPDDVTPDGMESHDYLCRLVAAGMQARWPAGAPAKIRRQVDHELGIIRELNYAPYFLTVHDIIRFARSRGILCQGRGSAANSAVCYCLGITAVDPQRMDLLFERFVSRERNEPPDIDVDFESGRREEVIQYIYRKYGRRRAALAATLITYRRRSALRDVGKALGFEAAQIEALSHALAWWDETLPADRVREAGLDPDREAVQRLLRHAAELQGFPRHLSQHVGGFVITRGALSDRVPVENAAMPERTVIQWDKDDLDAMGMLKIDCLGLGMLGAIHDCFDLVGRHHGRPLSLDSIPADDPAVYAMIQRADTIGVFQIESRAQMSMLPRLRPACYYDLVIQIAIVRPGPIQGDMVHPFLKRRQGREPVSYPGEEVRAVLERTLGVPIFQEQIIKLAMVAAGFSAGEADQLRRAIGAWRKKEKLAHFQQRLVEGMRARGYSEDFARQICHQIQGFGEYGFPESHAAGFALLAWTSAWLKHHYPAAFACALLNNQPMGFYAPAQLVNDARRHGVEVRPVDVRYSDEDCTLEAGADGAPALRLGLRLVRGLSRRGIEALLAARAQRPFTDGEDLCRRAALNRRDREALAAADALRGLAGHRHRARWAVLGEVLGAEPAGPLVRHAEAGNVVPMLPRPGASDEVVSDYVSTGLSLRPHPLSFLRRRLEDYGAVPAERLPEIAGERSICVAGIVITRQHPSSGKGVIFLTLEDETGYVNVVVWPSLLAPYRRAILSARLLGVHGKLQRADGVTHLVAQRLEDLSELLGRLQPQSRDFR